MDLVWYGPPAILDALLQGDIAEPVRAARDPLSCSALQSNADFK